MRVTQFSKYTPIQSAIEDIQSRKYLNELRLATGKQIVDITEQPTNLLLKKNLEFSISQNQQFQKNIDYSINFIQHTTETLQTIINNLAQIRDTAIDATQTGISNSVSVLAKKVRGILDDIVKDLNADYDGNFLFSGTLTNKNSIQKPANSKTELPYEIITETPTAENPSGLKVIFKGNSKKIIINTSNSSSEAINTTADEMFDGVALEPLNKVIELYNLLYYDQSGQPRSENDLFNQDDLIKLDSMQKELGKLIDKLTRVNGANGILLNRMEALSEQNKNILVNFEAYKSKIADTDYAKTSLELAKDQTALQFTLQVAARLSQIALFDFLR